MDLHLSGKVAIVTGASKGIGLAVTQSLAGEGVSVVAGARTISEDLALLEQAGRVRSVRVDLTAAGGPDHLVTETVATYGGLDILINNVGGVHPRLEGFLSISDQDWTASLALNLYAAIRTTRAALPHLLARGAGAIVTTCSINAFLPDPLVMDYSAAKAALANFCKALSKEVGPRGIRVNCVSPGPVATDLWLGTDGVAATLARSNGTAPEAVATSAAVAAVSGRFSRPQEVADLIVLLASDRAGNVTGANFVIDGGMTTTLV